MIQMIDMTFRLGKNHVSVFPTRLILLKTTPKGRSMCQFPPKCNEHWVIDSTRAPCGSALPRQRATCFFRLCHVDGWPNSRFVRLWHPTPETRSFLSVPQTTFFASCSDDGGSLSYRRIDVDQSPDQALRHKPSGQRRVIAWVFGVIRGRPTGKFGKLGADFQPMRWLECISQNLRRLGMRLMPVLAAITLVAPLTACGQDSQPAPTGPIGSPGYSAEAPTAPGQSFATLIGQPMADGGGSSGGGGDGGNQQDNGTNPAVNLTTFILSNEYFTLEGGNRINATYARLKFPTFGKRGSVLFEVPFVYYDLRATFPNIVPIGGLGDVRIQGTFNFWSSPERRLTAVLFGQAFLPTADNAVLANPLPNESFTVFNLGTGKYVLGCGLGLVYAFSPNFLFAPVYLYEPSVFGNPNRPTIRRGKWRVFAMYAFENGVHFLPEFQVVTNYLTGNNDIYLAPEVGFTRKGTTFFSKPGFGIDAGPGERQWGLELGLRVQF